MVVKRWSKNIKGVWFNFWVRWSREFRIRLGFKIDIAKHYEYIFAKGAKLVFIDFNIYIMNLTLHLNINWQCNGGK